MVKRIIWSAKAKQELFDILKFWNEHNHSNSYSLKLYQKIHINLQYISENNFIGRKTSMDNVHMVVVSHYLLFYEVTEQAIHVLCLYDSRRSPKDLRVK